MDTRTFLRACVAAALAAGPVWLMARSPVDAQQAPAATLESPVLESALVLAQMGESRLPSDVILSLASGQRGAGILEEAARAAKVPGGAEGQEAARRSRVLAMRVARALIPLLEREFIHDPQYSTLDLLPPGERARFKAFAWHDDDYPGGPEGPNEAVGLEMDAALSRVRPERRANSTAAAVVSQPEFDEAMWAHIQSRRRDVPGQQPRQLDADALVAFRMMEEAADRDGVDLRIASADRRPEVAQRNAERVNNPYATARFSSHILGLAMDLYLSDGKTKVDEVTTRPMSNIIAMRRTAPHKWMFLKGAAYGWYPYQHEPWHWEYNPPGFRERFRTGLSKAEEAGGNDG